MTVTVYDWATKTLVAKQASENISAGGIDGGGVTVDGAIEFVNNRVGRKDCRPQDWPSDGLV